MIDNKSKSPLKSTKLFIIEGKTDLLLIGMFFMVVALFILLYSFK